MRREVIDAAIAEHRGRIVKTTGDGLLAEFTQWCKAEFSKLHGLRHSHASQLWNAGVNIKAVSARPGHGSAARTLSAYAHCLPGADEDAAEKIDALLSVANQ
jgi:integrase